MLEKKYYKIADYIGCMSPGNIDFVKHSNPEVSFEKYRLLPNWGNPEVYQAPDMRIRKAYDLDGKYVLVYGGNMGRPQGLDTFLELARMKREFSDVVFLFIGNGTERKRLIEKKELLHLDNVRFMDFIPKTDLIQLMRTCDVGLISLNKDLATPSIPSKTIDYWKIKLPILAAVDAVTDYGYNILDTTRSGVWALATDMEKLSEQFDLLYSRPELRKVFGENGYNYLHEECSSAKTYSRIIEVLH